MTQDEIRTRKHEIYKELHELDKIDECTKHLFELKEGETGYSRDIGFVYRYKGRLHEGLLASHNINLGL
jgi:hypothetical protein